MQVTITTVGQQAYKAVAHEIGFVDYRKTIRGSDQIRSEGSIYKHKQKMKHNRLYMVRATARPIKGTRT